MPVIAISPETEDVEECLAYLLKPTEDGYILDESIFVDEDYAMANPVWVINYSEASEDQATTQNTPPANDSNVGTEIVTVYLGSFKSTKQHDPWYKGGSEYVVAVSAPSFEVVDDKVKMTSDNLVQHRVTLTRKEIKQGKKVLYPFNVPVVTEWKKELSQIAVLVYEQDDTLFKESVDVELSVSLDKQTYGLKVKFPISSGDDILGRTTYYRNFIFSTNNYNNGQWTEFTSGGVFWTLPFRTATVIY